MGSFESTWTGLHKKKVTLDDDNFEDITQEIYTDKERVKCNDDHPLVYYTVPKGGYVICGYCNKKWIRK